MYVEISVDNIINILILQILINMFLYFNVSDRNGLYAKRTSLFVIVTQHSNAHVHEALEIIFFTGYAGVEIALIRLSGLSKNVAGQVDCPTEVIRRISW